MENQRILIDTSILIDYLRKVKKDQTVFYRLSLNYQYCISAITEFEFLVGQTEKNALFIQQILKKIPVLPFSSTDARTGAKLYQDLKSKNQLISLADMLIAASAISHNMPLLTLNKKHFERINNLTLIDEL